MFANSLDRSDLATSWNQDLSNILINTTNPQLHLVATDDTTKKSLTQAMISEEYPPETWTHAYIDGSATAAIQDGGAGVFICHTTGRTETVSVATGKHCTNYKAEVEAIMQALTIIKESTEDCSQVIILTDALSVLEALLNCKLPSLSRILGQLCNTRRMALQWIPAHCGIPGNEKADKLAKHGAGGIQPQNNISYKEKVTVIKTMMKRKPAKDDYHLLERQEQVTIFRLRTCHNRLNAHMH